MHFTHHLEEKIKKIEKELPGDFARQDAEEKTKNKEALEKLKKEVEKQNEKLEDQSKVIKQQQA